MMHNKKGMRLAVLGVKGVFIEMSEYIANQTISPTIP